MQVPQVPECESVGNRLRRISMQAIEDQAESEVARLVQYLNDVLAPKGYMTTNVIFDSCCKVTGFKMNYQECDRNTFVSKVCDKLRALELTLKTHGELETYGFWMEISW